MKKFARRLLSVLASAALFTTCVLPVGVAASSGHQHHIGDTNLNDPEQYNGSDKCIITLTDPHDNAKIDPDNALYGAYQIFSGSVPKSDDENAPKPGDLTNPGTESTSLPITDIKWGNAFGKQDGTTEEIKTWRTNVISFVFALSDPKFVAKIHNPDDDYSYAFDDFTAFSGLVTKEPASNPATLKLNTDYVDGSEEIKMDNTGKIIGNLDNIKYDKLALAVANILAEDEYKNDHEFLQDFADILGGFGAGDTVGSYKVPGYVKQYYGSTEWSTSDNNCTIAVPPGYYMVLDLSNEGATDQAYSARMLFVANNVTQQVKADAPTVAKTIEEGIGDKTTAVAGVGDELTFNLIGTLPSNYSNFLLGYQYIFEDTLSAGLTPQEITGKPKEYVTVKAKGVLNSANEWQEGKEVVITKDSFFKDQQHYHITTDVAYIETYDEDKNTLTVDFPCLKEIVVTEGSATYTLGVNPENTNQRSEITVSYKAKVNEKAVVSPAADNDHLNGNPNTVELTYSNNPQSYDDTATTTPSSVEVYTFGLNISKVDSAEFINSGSTADSALAGANFSLLRPAKGQFGFEIAKVTKIAPNIDDEVKPFGDKEYYSIINWEFMDGSAAASIDDLQSAVKTFLEKAGINPDDYTLSTSELGDLLISGLNDEVRYTLVESSAPEDYAIIDPFQVTLTAQEDSNKYNGKLKGADVTNTVGENESFSLKKFVQLTDKFGTTDNGSAEMIVANFKYEDLPSTGGIGVYIYYIIGGVLIAGAIVLFAVNRKKARKN